MIGTCGTCVVPALDCTDGVAFCWISGRGDGQLAPLTRGRGRQCARAHESESESVSESCADGPNLGQEHGQIFFYFFLMIGQLTHQSDERTSGDAASDSAYDRDGAMSNDGCVDRGVFRALTLGVHAVLSSFCGRRSTSALGRRPAASATDHRSALLRSLCRHSRKYRSSGDC